MIIPDRFRPRLFAAPYSSDTSTPQYVFQTRDVLGSRHQKSPFQIRTLGSDNSFSSHPTFGGYEGMVWENERGKVSYVEVALYSEIDALSQQRLYEMTRHLQPGNFPSDQEELANLRYILTSGCLVTPYKLKFGYEGGSLEHNFLSMSKDGTYLVI